MYNLKPRSADGRVFIWEVSARVAGDNIFFGIGEGNFPFEFINEQADYFSDSRLNSQNYGYLVPDPIGYAFNDYLQVQIEMGFVGIALYISIVFFLLKHLIGFVSKYPTDIFALALLCLIISLLVAGLTSYPSSLLPFKPFFFVIAACIVNHCFLTQLKYGGVIPIRVLNVGIIFFTLTMSLIFGFYTVKTFLSFKSWQDSIIYSNKFQTRILADSFPFLSSNGYYLYYLGHLHLENGAYPQAIDILNQAKSIYPSSEVYLDLAKAYIGNRQVQLAEKEYKFLVEAFPSNINHLVALALFIAQINRKYY